MKLRIATWNIFLGHEMGVILKSFKSQKDFKEIDLIALQEASIHNGIEDAKVIAQALGQGYQHYQITAQNIRGQVQANAIIWNAKKIKLSKKATFSLPDFHAAQLGRIEKAIKRVLPTEKRNSVIIEGTVGKKSFRFYSAHFDVIGFAHKKEQLQRILQHDQKAKSVDFVCVAGDLNTFKILKRPLWTKLSSLANVYGFLDITTTIKWTFSRRSFRFRQKTDSIFLKNYQKMKFSSWSSNIVGSDHIPIFAIIEL